MKAEMLHAAHPSHLAPGASDVRAKQGERKKKKKAKKELVQDITGYPVSRGA